MRDLRRLGPPRLGRPGHSLLHFIPWKIQKRGTPAQSRPSGRLSTARLRHRRAHLPTALAGILEILIDQPAPLHTGRTSALTRQPGSQAPTDPVRNRARRRGVHHTGPRSQSGGRVPRTSRRTRGTRAPVQVIAPTRRIRQRSRARPQPGLYPSDTGPDQPPMDLHPEYYGLDGAQPPKDHVT